MRRSHRVYFYSKSGESSALAALQSVPPKQQARIVQIFEHIKSNGGHFEMPFVNHVIGGLHVMHATEGIEVYFATARKRIMMLCIRTKRQAAAAVRAQAVALYRDFMSLEERYEFP